MPHKYTSKDLRLLFNGRHLMTRPTAPAETLTYLKVRRSSQKEREDGENHPENLLIHLKTPRQLAESESLDQIHLAPLMKVAGLSA